MPHHPWRDLGPGPVLLDASMGTALFDRGLRPGTAPETWILDRPEAILDVHLEHVRAGARVLHTNTFGAIGPALVEAGLETRADAICREAVRLAREATGDTDSRILVAGAIGPSRLPADDADEARRAFRRAGRRLTDAGVDTLALETMTSHAEARLALAALRDTCDRPVSVALTIVRAGDGFRTPAGDEALEAAVRLANEGAFAVGFQCSHGPSEVADAAQRLLLASPVPVFAKPNAGFPPLAPEDFAERLGPALRAGLAAVGGCCGTRGDYLRALAGRPRDPEEPVQDSK